MIADIMFEVAWKSTVVSAAVVALLFLMRSRTPSSRVAVGGLGLVLLVLLPAIVLTLALLPVPTIEMAAPGAAAIAPLPLAMEPGAMLHSLSSPSDPAPAVTVSPELFVALLWAAGALVVALRLAAGIATLRRWSERAALVSSPRWRAVLRRCGAPEATLLLVSDDASAPLSWGWRMPVILVDRATMAKPAEAEAVIAHEAAHLARGDWPRLIAARAVIALFWFNPLVWLLERLHLQDIEEAADAEATRRVQPAHYAQALLNVARSAAIPAGANSIASGALAKRIREVLSNRPRSRWERTWRIGALTGVAAVAAPIAVVQFVVPAASATAAVASVLAQAPAPAASAPVAPASVTSATVVEMVPAPQPLVAALAVAQASPPAAPAAPAIIDREELDRVLEVAQQATAEAAAAMREVDPAKIRAEVATALADARSEMLRGADEMERGAVEMREGAAKMREEARKLRDPAYRRKIMEEHRARGDRVPTEQELIAAIPKMEEGAAKMDSGVDKMREGAAKMRRQAQDR